MIFSLSQSLLLAVEGPSGRRLDAKPVELNANLDVNSVGQSRFMDFEQRKHVLAEKKDKLVQIETAEAEEKQELLEEFRAERTSLAKQRQERERAEPQRVDQVGVYGLPREFQAMKAKIESRKREVEDLKAALEQAQPTERVALIDAYSRKQLASWTERTQSIGSQKNLQQKRS